MKEAEEAEAAARRVQDLAQRMMAPIPTMGASLPDVMATLTVVVLSVCRTMRVDVELFAMSLIDVREQAEAVEKAGSILRGESEAERGKRWEAYRSAAPILFLCGCDDGECLAVPTLECACDRCLREIDQVERYHTCEAHRASASIVHQTVRGQPAQWVKL